MKPRKGSGAESSRSHGGNWRNLFILFGSRAARRTEDASALASESAFGTPVNGPASVRADRRHLVLIPALGLGVALLLQGISAVCRLMYRDAFGFSEVLTFLALTALAMAAVNLLIRIKLRRRVLWLGLGAILSLMTSQAIDSMVDVRNELLSRAADSSGAEFFETFEETLLLLGLALILVAAYLTLLESIAIGRRLAHERGRLRRQIAHRERMEEALTRSEERYRLIFEGALDGIALLGNDLNFALVNQRMIEVSGYSREELMTMNALDLVIPEDRARILENRRKRLSGGAAERTYKFRMLNKHEKLLLIEASLDLLERDGDILGVQGVFRDVTDRWEAERELREREENYRQLFEGISDVVLVISPEQHILAFNEVTTHRMGYTQLELLAQSYQDLCPVWDREHSERYLLHTLDQGEARWESEHIHRDGAIFPVDVSARRIRYQDRPAVILIARDITERKDVEETLRSIAVGVSTSTGEEFFKNFVRHLAYALHADIVFLTELASGAQTSLRILAVYSGAMSEESASDMASGAAYNHLFQLGVICHPHHAREIYPQDSFLQAAGAEGYVAAPLFDHAGAPLGALVAVAHSPINDPGSAKSLMSIYAARASVELERSRTENALRASEARMRTMFEGIDDAMLVHDFEGRIVDCNAAACRQLGYTRDEFVHMRTSDVDTPAFAARFAARLQAQQRDGRLTCEGEHRAKDGRIIPVEIHSSIIEFQGKKAILASARNITERRRMEEENRRIQSQMLQAQKLESLGVLAGGIAHDFNNLLMGVLGNASLAMLDLPPESPARHTMQEIETAALRAGDLAKQMLAYSGRGKFLVQSLDLSALITEMSNLIEASIPKTAALYYRLTPDVPHIEADVTQMRQLLMNLITNAADAIGETMGNITVMTGAMVVDRTYLRTTLLDDSLTEGPYVYLDVQDSGCGMDPDTRKRMFDPFFSTKFLGRGLGLAAVLGIVRGHNGAIKVDSEVGRGTTFRVLLPAAARQEPVTLEQDASVWRPGGAILVVDDEETVRTIAQRTLERQGFRVLCAKDGFEGIELFRGHMDEITLVLLDMTMPLMDGQEVLLEMRKLQASVKVLLSSGYSEPEATGHFTGLDLAGFIQKPYRVQDLIGKVKSVLDVSGA